MVTPREIVMRVVLTVYSDMFLKLFRGSQPVSIERRIVPKYWKNNKNSYHELVFKI